MRRAVATHPFPLGALVANALATSSIDRYAALTRFAVSEDALTREEFDIRIGFALRGSYRAVEVYPARRKEFRLKLADALKASLVLDVGDGSQSADLCDEPRDSDRGRE